MQCRLGEWKRGGACFSVILLSILDRRSSNFAHLDVHEEFAPRVPHAALTAVVREMDFVAQFKPGCFGVLLPAVDQYDAGNLAHRLCRAVEAYFPSAVNEPKAIVVAAGLAEATEGDHMVRLLTRAEEALQNAVQEGGGGCFRHNGLCAEPVAPLANTTA